MIPPISNTQKLLMIVEIMFIALRLSLFASIGASDEQIKKLNHAPHYMVCDTNTTEQRHGLGLLIVKQIMNGHGGTVTIDHSKYGGFKVALMLPQ